MPKRNRSALPGRSKIAPQHPEVEERADYMAPVEEPEVRTFNKFAVAVETRGIVIMAMPGPFAMMPVRLSKPDALNLAAWLSVLAEEDDGEFDRLRTAILNT